MRSASMPVGACDLKSIAPRSTRSLRTRAADTPRGSDTHHLTPSPHAAPLRWLASALAAAALAVAPPPAAAENVRVEDVESPTLRAGLEAANEGRLDAAERFFKTYLAQEDPGSASAYSNLGNVHLQQGLPQLALEDFTKAVELAPAAPVPRLNRSIAYEALGVAEEAAGRAPAAAQLYAAAIADCDAAIAADPAEFAAWFDRGNVQMRTADFGGARASFERAADLAPGLAGYRLRAATLQYQTGDVGKAKQTVRGVLRKNGRSYGEAHAVLAGVLWAEGDREGAEEEVAAAMDIDGGLWADEAAVRERTRWPPALYDAYARLLRLQP